ncbi:MAG: SDR family NAD(P)-dependent oxidoreductase, partial [Betaproteobacteria bacterium]
MVSSVKELFDLKGQLAVVTGGATGIGLQMAKGLAEAGANIVICSRRADVCEAAAAEI